MTISVEIKKAITADAVVNVLAGADAPLSSSAVAKALRTSQTKKVVGVLTTLVRQETLVRVGSQYKLRDPGRYDAPLATSQGTRRTLLPTNKLEIAAGERRKAVAKLASSRKDSPASDKTDSAELPSPPVEKKRRRRGDVKAHRYQMGRSLWISQCQIPGGLWINQSPHLRRLKRKWTKTRRGISGYGMPLSG